MTEEEMRQIISEATARVVDIIDEEGFEGDVEDHPECSRILMEAALQVAPYFATKEDEDE